MLSHDSVLSKGETWKADFLVFHTWADWVILTCDTAVGGHHQRMDPWVFDNVLPMDCVCMTQELVLVNIHTSTQDLCDKKRKHTIWSVSLYLIWHTTDVPRHSMFKSKSLSCLSNGYFVFFFMREEEQGWRLAWATDLGTRTSNDDCCREGRQDNGMSYCYYYNLCSFPFLLFFSSFSSHVASRQNQLCLAPVKT